MQRQTRQLEIAGKIILARISSILSHMVLGHFLIFVRCPKTEIKLLKTLSFFNTINMQKYSFEYDCYTTHLITEKI